MQQLESQIAQTRARRRVIFGCALLVVPVALLLGGYGRGWIVPTAVTLCAVAWTARRLLGLRADLVRLGRRADYYMRAMERVEGRWRGQARSEESKDSGKPAAAHELGVVGAGSLFELLKTTRTGVGAERLRRYLTETPTLQQARARQQAVRELKSRSELREGVAALGRYGFEDCDSGRLQAWLAMPLLIRPPNKSTVPHPLRRFYREMGGKPTHYLRTGSIRMMPVVVRWFLAVAGLVSLALALCGFAGLVHWRWILPLLAPWLAAQAVAALALRAEVKDRLDALLALPGDVAVLREGLALVAGEQFQSAKLVELTGRLSAGRASVLRGLERLLRLVERREDAVLFAFSTWLAGGTQLALATDAWRAKHGAELAAWLDAWAEFEALNALAGYAWEHPDDGFPELVEGAARFEAEALHHPLLPPGSAVANDIALGPATAFYLISGSNMAGKSTLLRTIGLNATLAAAGAPVCARRSQMNVFAVHASIGVEDALGEGKSRFLAEVERVGEAIRAAAAGGPVLFLIDEILGGTNSEDRRVAAEAVVRALVAAGAVGALSTHDLALAAIAEDPELKGRVMRMESEDEAHPLAFDFKLKEGIVRQRNGLAIVRMMEIDVKANG